MNKKPLHINTINSQLLSGLVGLDTPTSTCYRAIDVVVLGCLWLNNVLQGTFWKEALKSHKGAITLAFFRICSLAFLFSSFLASITLLETKLIRSAILDFSNCTLTISKSTKAQPNRKGSWLVIQKNGGVQGSWRQKNCTSSQRRFFSQGGWK